MAKSYNKYGSGSSYGRSSGSSYGGSGSSYGKNSGSSYGSGGSSYGRSSGSRGSGSSYGGGSGSAYNFDTAPSYFAAVTDSYANNDPSKKYDSPDNARTSDNYDYDSRPSRDREPETERVSNRSNEIRKKVNEKRGGDSFFLNPGGPSKLLKYQDLPTNTFTFNKPRVAVVYKPKFLTKVKRFARKYLFFIILPLIAVGIYTFYKENMSIELKRNSVGKVEIKSISDADFIEVLRTGTPDEIDRAFSLSPNVDLVDEKKRDIISVAVLNNANDSSIMHLLDHVENINKKDVNGLSPLANAILFHRNAPIIKKIIARGADVNDVSEKGTSILMTAAAVTDNPEILKTLISNGADVNYSNANKVTPLMMAVTTSTNPDIVKVLLGGGADPLAKDANGKSILEIAQKNPALVNTDVIQMLQAYYQPVEQSGNNVLQDETSNTQQNYMNTSNAPAPESSERTKNGPLPYGEDQNSSTEQVETGGSAPADVNNGSNEQNNTQENVPNNNESNTENNDVSLQYPEGSNTETDLIVSNVEEPSALVASEVQAKSKNRKKQYLEYSQAYNTDGKDVDKASVKEDELQYSGNKDMEDYLTQEEEANKQYSRYTKSDRDYSF